MITRNQRCTSRSFPLAELLEEIASGLAHATQLGENEFSLEGDRTIKVIVDRDRVKRALTNVLENALRFSPAGAPIELCWTALDKSSTQITVHDRGPGIDAELLPHVFEPGIRGNPAAGGTEEGAGLGLTIAKRLLEHQDGAIAVENHPSGGALIIVIAPAIVIGSVRDEADRPESPSGWSKESCTRRRSAYTGDCPINRSRKDEIHSVAIRAQRQRILR